MKNELFYSPYKEPGIRNNKLTNFITGTKYPTTQYTTLNTRNETPIHTNTNLTGKCILYCIRAKYIIHIRLTNRTPCINAIVFTKPMDDITIPVSNNTSMSTYGTYAIARFTYLLFTSNTRSYGKNNVSSKYPIAININA